MLIIRVLALPLFIVEKQTLKGDRWTKCVCSVVLSLLRCPTTQPAKENARYIIACNITIVESHYDIKDREHHFLTVKQGMIFSALQ